MTKTTTPTSWPAPATPPPVGWEPAKKMRPLTGVILAWNALMAAWIVWGVFVTAHQSSNCASEVYADACRSGAGIGAAVAIGGILFLTAIVDVILGVIWMVTKKD